MATLTVGPAGELTLPADVILRKGFKPDRPVRIVETRSGVLLVPISDDVSAELADEIDAWQELAEGSWSSFPFEDPDE
jgi:hypothetical protein